MIANLSVTLRCDILRLLEKSRWQWSKCTGTSQFSLEYLKAASVRINTHHQRGGRWATPKPKSPWVLHYQMVCCTSFARCTTLKLSFTSCSELRRFKIKSASTRGSSAMSEQLDSGHIALKRSWTLAGLESMGRSCEVTQGHSSWPVRAVIT